MNTTHKLENTWTLKLQFPLVITVYLFTPGLLSVYLTDPRQLKSLVWGSDSLPMSAEIGFSLRKSRGGFLTCVRVVKALQDTS